MASKKPAMNLAALAATELRQQGAAPAREKKEVLVRAAPKKQPVRLAARGEDAPATRSDGRKVRFGGAVRRTDAVGTVRKDAAAGVVQRITAWSFSRLKDWLQCPFKAKLKHVLRMKEPGSAAMERGSSIHKMAEDYAAGRIAKLPAELALFKARFAVLRKARPQVEESWAFNSSWGETDWFSSDAWVRIKTDACYVDTKTGVVHIIDHKTGKPREDHEEQLSLYATAAFIKYPNAVRVSAELWYLDTGDVTSCEYERDELDAMRKHWNAEVKPMMTDTLFAPRCGNYCRWCHFRAANGGPCQY